MQEEIKKKTTTYITKTTRSNTTLIPAKTNTKNITATTTTIIKIVTTKTTQKTIKTTVKTAKNTVNTVEGHLVALCVILLVHEPLHLLPPLLRVDVRPQPHLHSHRQVTGSGEVKNYVQV